MFLPSDPLPSGQTGTHFGCTSCGICCHGWKVPLTLREAVEWLQHGHAVDLMVEAYPAHEDPSLLDAEAHYQISQ